MDSDTDPLIASELIVIATFECPSILELLTKVSAPFGNSPLQALYVILITAPLRGVLPDISSPNTTSYCSFSAGCTKNILVFETTPNSEYA